MHLAANLGCVSGQLSHREASWAREGARALGHFRSPATHRARKDWEPGGAGPLLEKTGISAPAAGVGAHPEHPDQGWPPSPLKVEESRPYRASTRKKGVPKGGVWEHAEAFPTPRTHAESWSHLRGYARKGSAGGSWCGLGGPGTGWEAGVVHRGDTSKLLSTHTSLEAKFPPSVLKAVLCPELWPSVPLRDTAQNAGESSIPPVCTFRTAPAPLEGDGV